MNEQDRLTHLDTKGQVQMVDVGNKPVSDRKAVAEGRIVMKPQTLAMIESGQHKKGEVLSIARVAGIMAAKRTADLIPLCHPIMLTRVNVDLDIDRDNSSVRCRTTTQTSERTGVEMEALTGTQVALLTIYDMCKAVDRAMEIGQIRLVYKVGGKSGEWHRGDNT